jgi:nitrite reductase/ring-hydroxylating ferredoxin subunit
MEELEDGWIAAIAASELIDDKAIRVMVGDQAVLLYRSGDDLFAIGDRCTHVGAPLHRGPIKSLRAVTTVTCPAHGSMFSLNDGRVMRGPARRREPAFDARIRDEQIEIRPRP